MKILIDATYITKETWYKSLSVYIFRFLDSVYNTRKKDFILLILPEIKDEINKKYPELEIIVYNPYSKKIKGNRFIKFIKRCKLYKYTVEKSGCDSLFLPNDLIMFSAIATRLRKTVVIHDMKSFNEKSILSFSYWIFWIYYWLLIKNANHVVAISNYTKTDILRFFPKRWEKKMDVVYNSVVIPKVKLKDTGINCNYILYVNALLPYKNIKTLIKCFALIKDQINQKLVIVGKKTEYWQNEILPLIIKEGIEDRIIQLQDISEEYLINLYRGADLFVTTSLKEGFGYTPIEAAMCGCPVVSTKCEALGDTTRNLLFYYRPPLDEYALAEQVVFLLKNPPSEKRLQLISEEYKRVYSEYKQIKCLLKIIQS